MRADEEMEKYRLQLESLERRESDQYKIGYLTRAVNDLSVFIKEHMEKEEIETAKFRERIEKLGNRQLMLVGVVALQIIGVPTDKILEVVKTLFLI